jgi:diguanylate cyclase (GGDEF)-like protein
LVAANADLERLARIDALTGLQNRNSGIENLHLEYRRLKRSGSVYSILFIDIDRFKDINDSYGHHAGDQVLKQVAASLEASLRETDFVARFGGEEFVAILPDTNAEEALPIAEKLRSDIAAQAFPIPIQVTISIGISMACHSDRNAEDAVHRADSALYQAKEGGRNAVRCR